MALEIVNAEAEMQQGDLFFQAGDQEKQIALMKVVDKMNRNLGDRAIFLRQPRHGRGLANAAGNDVAGLYYAMARIARCGLISQRRPCEKLKVHFGFYFQTYSDFRLA